VYVPESVTSIGEYAFNGYTDVWGREGSAIDEMMNRPHEPMGDRVKLNGYYSESNFYAIEDITGIDYEIYEDDQISQEVIIDLDTWYNDASQTIWCAAIMKNGDWKSLPPNLILSCSNPGLVSLRRDDYNCVYITARSVGSGIITMEIPMTGQKLKIPVTVKGSAISELKQGAPLISPVEMDFNEEDDYYLFRRKTRYFSFTPEETGLYALASSAEFGPPCDAPDWWAKGPEEWADFCADLTVYESYMNTEAPVMYYTPEDDSGNSSPVFLLEKGQTYFVRAYMFVYLNELFFTQTDFDGVLTGELTVTAKKINDVGIEDATLTGRLVFDDNDYYHYTSVDVKVKLTDGTTVSQTVKMWTDDYDSPIINLPFGTVSIYSNLRYYDIYDIYLRPGKSYFSVRIGALNKYVVMEGPSPVPGDIDGDGDADIEDLLVLRDHIFDTYILFGSRFAAADLNRDGKIDVSDILSLCRFIIDPYNHG